MAQNQNYCMGCMKPIAPGASVCAHCYYDSDASQKAPYLEKGTMIAEKYLVGKIISYANDSVTYIGLDTTTQAIVNIHEFLPIKIILRQNKQVAVEIKNSYETMYANCLNSFLNLWSQIKSLGRINCLPYLTDIIECNNTAYAITENIDCISLKEYFEKTKKPLSWPKTFSAFKPILLAFDKLHKVSVVHGGISPTTIGVGADGKLHVTGFSIPQCHSPVAELTTSPVSGFSAFELYEGNMTAYPESDIYSLMAMMFYSCTGIVPPKSTDRAIHDDMMVPANLDISDRNLEGLFSGLCVYPEDRCTLVDHLINELTPETIKKLPQTKTNTTPIGANTNKKTSSSNKQKNNSKDKKKDEKSYLLSLAIRTFSAVVVICAILFCTLYTTFLYKNYSIPVLDNAFSWATFLPVTKDRQEQSNSNINSESTSQTEQTTSSTERAYVTVDDFTKLTYDEIKNSEIYNRNFTIEYVFQASETIEENNVISQNLTVGESVLQGTNLKLTISSGIEDIEVPLVIGMDYATARYTLRKAGLTVKKEVVENPGGNTADEVCDANIVAGIKVKKGTEIILSVWDVDPDAPDTQESTEETTATTTKVDSVDVGDIED